MIEKFRSLVILFILMFVWEAIVQIGLFPRYLFPSASDVLLALTSPPVFSAILSNFPLTCLRALVGLVLGVAAGIGVGVLFSAKSMHHSIQSVATLLFSIPSVAWVPILMVWIGLKDFELPVAVSFMCSFPPVLYGMINALRLADKGQIEVALVLGAKPFTIFVKIIIPQAILKIMPQLKTETIMVWKSVFVTEMVALSSGLGYLAMVYSTTLEMEALLAVVIVLSLTTIVIIEFFDFIERKLSEKWGNTNGRN